MYISQAEYSLLQIISTIFSPAYSLDKSWLVNGLWRDAHEKLILLLRNRAFLTTSNLHEMGIQEFEFPFKTALVSYQEGIADKHATYYQQRFQATETDEIKTLKKFLYGEKTDFRSVHKHYELLELFNLKHLLDEEVIKLSNGESRKATILKALLSNPQVLILDNPYAGIDQNTVPDLDKLFNELTRSGLNLVLFSNTEIPSWVNNVLWINSPEEVENFSRMEYIDKKKTNTNLPGNNLFQNIKIPTVEFHSDTIVKLSNVNVIYGEKRLLQRINWEIKQGEKWVLKGENGAGKSTLLSLIFADHPQAYANDIELFGTKRGSGESIWDIKERMALYSPEFYYYFDKTRSCREAIVSGIYFHPFKKGIRHTDLESFAKMLFLQFFNEDKLDVPLSSLTGVNQRLVLFLRALSQNAALVLLDEPFQGFDQELTDKCKLLTELCCQNKTLIFVSHNPNDIPALTDNVFQLNNGSGTVVRQKY